MNRETEIVENPCKYFLKWKTLKSEEDDRIIGADFVRYDKDLKENVTVSRPLKFAVLTDDFVTFKGYNEKKQCGVYSNEASKPEHLVKVKDKDGICLEFKLKDYKIYKDKLSAMGAKYTKSVYIAVPADEGFEIYNLQLSGAALTGAVDRDNMSPDEKQDGWFGFTKVNKNKMLSNFFTLEEGLDGYKLKKKGATRFTIPVFKVGDLITGEEGAQIDQLYKELKEYFNYYFSKPEEVEVPAEVAEENDAKLPWDDAE